MYGGAGRGAYNSFKQSFFKSQKSSFFTSSKQQSFKATGPKISNHQLHQMSHAQKLYQLQLVRMSSTMSLILSMNHSLIISPESSAVQEEDADAEEDDSQVSIIHLFLSQIH
ncbi:hypothetical protein FGO68_gene4628 [Halteria grandinella]|uniref:Uncharacterized protein n=1 Tax=Halteria grandinella TaxID=5974 RepID=A0A8J8NBQ5_HALGN|nr:hypothetical protein FGO68_gene4628 [Halteria grandinella]